MFSIAIEIEALDYESLVLLKSRKKKKKVMKHVDKQKRKHTTEICQFSHKFSKVIELGFDSTLKIFQQKSSTKKA